VALSAASMYSTPNLASRSRCSTTIVPTVGSLRSERSPLRRPFKPLPTSLTVFNTDKDFRVPNSTSLAICRSKSFFWSAEETRPYTATRAVAV